MTGGNRRFAMFCGLLATAACVDAQQQPTFRADVALVHVDAEVRLENGRVLPGLQQGDFRVFDNGEEQHISSFLAEDQALDLALLFDVSGSMRQQIQRVAAVAHQSVELLRQGDRVSISTFNTEANLILWPTEDLTAVERSLQLLPQMQFAGGTRIQDAVRAVAERIIRHGEEEQRRRRAVLVVTDNLGRPAAHRKGIVEDLWEADASLNGLVVPNGTVIARQLMTRGAKLKGGIDELVEKTGGDLIRTENLAYDFPEMMSRLRSRYSLYYRLPEEAPDKLRTLRVELTPGAQQRYAGARVIFRSGYRQRSRDGYGFMRR